MHNEFKTALMGGQTQLGLWSTLCSENTTEIVSGSGFDWILFDTEHAPIEVAGLLPLLRAAAATSVNPVVRPAGNDRVLIKKILDLGAPTILVPYVQSVAEAKAAVSAAKYPPVGMRGVAGSTRASAYGRDIDYLHTANDAVCVLVQLETTEALTATAHIAALDGIDGVFIGPSDLAASMGYMGNPGHDKVQQAIRQSLGEIQSAGKPAGILAVTEADAQRYLEWGFNFVAVGIDAGLLRQAADLLAQQFST